MAQTALDLHHINTVTPWELKHKLVALNILTSDENSKELDNALELSKNDERVIQELAASLVRAGRNIQLGCKSPFLVTDPDATCLTSFSSFLPTFRRTALRLGDRRGDRQRHEDRRFVPLSPREHGGTA